MNRKVRKSHQPLSQPPPIQPPSTSNHHHHHAAAGYVRQVHLINFLTHDNLVVQFINKINFIHGQNGSGKSAVLASIMIGLGGRANHTGRGQNLTNLIQDNKSYCSITVHLSNQGPDAFEPDTYGDVIIVVRKITRQGCRSTYSLRNHLDKEISKKKKDLASITDHFNIQVENSLTWLTQDLAKEFLMNVTDAELYKFFAVGAEITQTRDTYRVIGEQLVSLCDKIKTLSHSLNTLKQKRTEWKTVQRELQVIGQLQQQLIELSNELNWCQINEMEAVLHQLKEKRTTEITSIDEAIKQINQLQHHLEFAIEKVHEAEVNAQSSFDANELSSKEKLLVSARMKRAQALQDLESIKSETAQTQSNLKLAEDRLLQVEQQLSHNGSQVRKQNTDRLNSLRSNVIQSTHRIKEIDALISQMNREDYPSIRDSKLKLSEQLKVLSSKSTSLQNQITAVQQASINRVNTWGNRMVQLLEAIAKTPWRGNKPIGPLGLYVVPIEKYRSTWLDYLRAAVGSSMFDFVVSNVHDRNTLQDLLSQFQQRHSKIIITNMQEQLHLEGYLPDARFLTALDTLDITNPTVKRVLVVNKQIEQRILIEDRREAEKITSRGFPPNSVGVFLPNGYLVGTRSGALGMTSGSKWSGAICPFGLKMTGYNEFGTDGNHLDQMRTKLEDLKQEQARKQSEFRNLESLSKDKELTMQKLQTERSTLDRQCRSQEREVTSLEESMLVEEPVELATIQDTIQQFNESLRTYQVQLPVVQHSVDVTINDVRSIEAKIAELKKMRDQAKNYAATKQQAIRTARQRVGQIENEIHGIQQTVAHHQSMQEMINVQIDQQQCQLDQALRAQDQEAVHDRGTCSNDRPRTCPVRTRSEIQQMINAQQLQITAIQTRHAAMTLQEATDRANLAKEQYGRAKDELIHLQTVVNRLRGTLHARATSFSMLVHSISRLAKHAFRQHMKKRGYEADLTFDHDQMLLHVIANKLDNNADRTMKSYSGGEKSFSTVCLLLALWDAIPSPIRALDEFDVFQDEVMRRVTMQLLIDAAKDSESQFLFITPLNLANLATKDDPDVSIVWLPAPVRNNVA